MGFDNPCRPTFSLSLDTPWHNFVPKLPSFLNRRMSKLQRRLIQPSKPSRELVFACVYRPPLWLRLRRNVLARPAVQISTTADDGSGTAAMVTVPKLE